MMSNCAFLQYWEKNFDKLPEPVWKAACTNIIRGVNGENIILPVVQEWQGNKFNKEATIKKLNHYLNDCTPQTCEYIKQELNFQDCSGNCPERLKAPCSWSIAKMPQAIASIRAVENPTAEEILNPNFLKLLYMVKQNSFKDYAQFKAKCKGKINLNDLEREVKKAGGENIPMLQEGQSLGDITTCQKVESTPLNLKIPANFSYREDGVYEVKKTDYGYKQTYHYFEENS